MRVEAKEPVRHFVCHLERGESVMASLRKVARDHGVTEAWVQGRGSLEWVELAASGGAPGAPIPTRRFETPCEVPSLVGTLRTVEGETAIELGVVLARETDNGVEALAGRLVAARVDALELWLTCFEAGEAGEATEGREGREGREGLEGREGGRRAPAASPSPAAPGGVSWAMAAEVSAQTAERAVPERRSPRVGGEASGEPVRVPAPLPERGRPEAAPLDELSIAVGDWVEHQSFGLCRVDRVDEDDGLLIKLPNGRRKLIKITYLEVLLPRQDGPRRIFPLRPRRPG